MPTKECVKIFNTMKFHLRHQEPKLWHTTSQEIKFMFPAQNHQNIHFTSYISIQAHPPSNFKYSHRENQQQDEFLPLKIELLTINSANANIWVLEKLIQSLQLPYQYSPLHQIQSKKTVLNQPHIKFPIKICHNYQVVKDNRYTYQSDPHTNTEGDNRGKGVTPPSPPHPRMRMEFNKDKMKLHRVKR